MSRYTPLSGWRVSRFVFVVLLLTLACSRAARADTWSPGQMLTYSQNDWSNPTGPAGQLLDADFDSIYASSGGAVQIGAPDSSGFVMLFDSPDAIQAYLPQGGLPQALTASLVDPTTGTSGIFGGVVLALELDVDFSDAGLFGGSSGFKLGDLELVDTGVSCVPDGTTVRTLLADANAVLGGAPGPCSSDLVDVDAIVEAMEVAFPSGNPSLFAQENLLPPGGTSGGGGGGTNMPEPPSALLLGVGLLGLGIFQYMRHSVCFRYHNAPRAS